MAFPTTVVKLTWGGTLFGTNEIWQSGLTLAVPGSDVGATKEQIQTLADSLGPMVDGYFLEIQGNISKAVTLEWTKTALLNETGKYALDAPGLYDTSPPIKGSPSASGDFIDTLPQAALVITLDSRKRGKRGRLSRFYLPMPALRLDVATGRANGTDAYFLSQSVGFINRVNAAASAVIPGLVVVAASSIAEGVINPIVAVRVGDVIDTQRSRRNALRETYQYMDLVDDPNLDPEA